MTDDRDRQDSARVEPSRDASVTEAAGIPEAIVDRRSPGTVDQAHVAAVRRGLEQVRLGQFATDGEVEAAFRRFGP